MKRIFNQTTIALTMTLVTACFAMAQTARAGSPAEQAIQAASANNQFAFVMFYRGNDAATQAMHGTLQSSLANRQNAVLVPVQIGNAAEQALVKQFDATRMPMPATATVAPNGAVCSVFPRRVTEQQLAAAIVSPGQTQILKALQDRKLVLLCAQPTAGAPVPAPVPHPPVPVAIIKGQANVLIGGSPAARMTDTTAPCMLPSCVPGGPGMIQVASTTVMIGNMGAARAGDTTLHSSCVAPIPMPAGKILPPGCPTVMIGG